MGNYNSIMELNKRQQFIESFLKLYEVIEVNWLSQSDSHISGIAIYDKNDPYERQEFIWHKSETDLPSNELISIIDKIVSEKWHNGDKLMPSLHEQNINNLCDDQKLNFINELLSINISMVDDGKETDTYFVHF